VVIYACKHHVRLLSPEPVVVETTTVYPGQGADIVMQSQSVQPQASVFPVGTLVPLPTLWLVNGGILALRNRQPGQIPNRSPCDGFDLPWSLEVEVARTKGIRSEQIASGCATGIAAYPDQIQLARKRGPTRRVRSERECTNLTCPEIRVTPLAVWRSYGAYRYH